MTKPNSVPYLISHLLLLFNFSYLIHASWGPPAAHSVSREQIACTMCAACDNPCQPILSPPPPSPPPPSPSPPPPRPPVQPECPPPPAPPVQPECPPPPNSNTPYYYSSPPPPPSIPTFMYYSPPPPASGGYYPAGGNPPPPNPIVPYFPYYYYSPPGVYNSISGSPSVALQKITVAFSGILTTMFFFIMIH